MELDRGVWEVKTTIRSRRTVGEKRGRERKSVNDGEMMGKSLWRGTEVTEYLTGLLEGGLFLAGGGGGGCGGWMRRCTSGYLP